MKIEAKEFEITLTYGELWNVAFNVRHAFLDDVKTHWVNHQQSWLQTEAERINLLKDLFTKLGRPDVYDNTMTDAKKILSDFNESKK